MMRMILKSNSPSNRSRLAPLTPIMDDESLLVTLSTAIGGFVGWRQAKSEVDWLCEPDGYPVGCTEYDIASFTDTIYPSSILTGLIFGLLAGVLLVGAWRRFVQQSQKK